MTGDASWGTRNPKTRKHTGANPPSDKGKATPATINGRCGRHDCGHLLTLHDEGGCSLAECSCHEAVAQEPGRRSPPMPLPATVDRVELRNRTGLASLKLTSTVEVDARGRACLVVTVGVAS